MNRVSETYGTIKHTNIYILAILKKKTYRGRKKFADIITKNLQNLMKNIHLHIQEGTNKLIEID